MATIDTGYVDILSNSTSADTVTALTDALAVADLKEVEIDVFLRASTPKSKVRIGIMYADNPFDFSGATATAFTGTELVGVTNAGWNYGAFSGDVSTIATPKLFCRFVALGKNDTGGVTGEGMQVRVLIRPVPFQKRIVAGPRRRVQTKGSDSAANTCPLTEPFETSGLEAHRLWREITSAATGNVISITFGTQETNTPDDPTSWSAIATLGSAVTSNQVVQPASFAAITFTKRFARYAASVINAAGGTAIEGAHVGLRAELRGC